MAETWESLQTKLASSQRFYQRQERSVQEFFAEEDPSKGVAATHLELIRAEQAKQVDICTSLIELAADDDQILTVEETQHAFVIKTNKLIGKLEDIINERDDASSLATSRNARSAIASPAEIQMDVEKEFQSYRQQLRSIENFVVSLDQNVQPQARINHKIASLQQIETMLTTCTIKRLSLPGTAEETEVKRTENELVMQRIEACFSKLFTFIKEPETNATKKHVDVKLEPMKIPPFDGSIKNWMTFRDKYIALVHNNQTLTNACKFTYLKQFIQDKNSPILTDMEEDAGYEDAWERVQSYYGDTRALISAHLDAITGIKRMSTESCDEMKRVLNDATKNVAAVKKLGGEEDLFEIFIAHIVLRQLDTHTLDLFETENKSKIPTWTQVKKFVETRSKILASLPAPSKVTQPKQTFTPTFPALPATNQTLMTSTQSPQMVQNQNSSSKSKAKRTPTCNFCSAEHWSSHCPSISNLSPDQIRARAVELNICLNCFGKHATSNCTSKYRCRKCKENHHSSMHVLAIQLQHPNSVSTLSSQQGSSNITVSTNTIATIENTVTMFSTVRGKVRSNNGKWIKARIALDSASSGCFMSSKFASKLNLPTKAIEIGGNSFGCNTFVSRASVVATIRNVNNTYSNEIEFLINDNLTGDIPTAFVPDHQINIPSKFNMSDPNYNRPGPIDILIGNLFVKKFETGEIINLENGIDIFNTVFGWSIAGGVNPSSTINNCAITQVPQINNAEFPKTKVSCNAIAVNVNSSSAHGNLNDLKQSIEKFYKLEDYKNNQRFLTHQETICEQHFEQTHLRLEDGSYQVDIPFKPSVSHLANNYHIARNQYLRNEKKLEKSPELKARYDDFLKEYRDLGHMKEVDISKDDPNLKVSYLPHHGVLKEESSTTKLRVVFNASSVTPSGISLNDTQYVGPNVQTEAFLLLLKFRVHRYIVKSDIEKMYRMVRINPHQTCLQRILWRDETGILKVFELLTVTYGTASGSYLATKVLKQIGIECRESNPEIAKIIEENSYVDDIIFGGENLQELQSKTETLIKTLESANMNLRKFNSNNQEFIESLPESKREAGINDENSVFKALGVRWNPLTDTISFVPNIIEVEKITKRICLSEVAKIFDPNGLLGPVTFQFKQFMKLCHQQQTNWDEKLPNAICVVWKSLVENIMKVKNIVIPRFVSIPNAINLQLHGFSDASNNGYGAVIYLRSQDMHGNVHVQLLCSKSRICSDELRMPRLELCSGVILTHLINQVGDALQIKERFCWMDSTIALHWISKEPAHLLPFVANRVQEIQSMANECHWSHVPGELNPADLLSRGRTADQLATDEIWWNGPKFLQLPREQWPISQIQFDSNNPDHLKEIRIKQVSTYKISIGENPFVTMTNDSSSFYVLKQKLMYVARFIHNCRAKKLNVEKRALPLSPDDAKDVEIMLSRAHQIVYMNDDYSRLQNKQLVAPKSKLATLSPIWDDENKLIRVGGRLDQAQITEDHKHPIALPPTQFAKILVRHIHINNVHSPLAALISFVKQRFWPLNLKRMARQVRFRCIQCYRARPTLAKQLLSSLPASRVNPGLAFQRTGVDYAGPITTKESNLRNAKRIKSYIAIFVCMATKAVHIEVVSRLTTDAFLDAFARFTARRGYPNEMNSDNGTNFVGADNVITELSEALAKGNEKFAKFFLNKDVKWKFICPRAPRWGGLWESAVKSMKTHLHACIGKTVLTFEALTTICCQIEAMLNSRPLTLQDDDPADIRPLTPGHFLIFRPMNSRPELPSPHKIVPDAYLYDRMIQIQNEFWKRWQAEYLSQLQQRPKDNLTPEVFKEGQVVLICDFDGSPVLHWPLGRIQKTYNGKDGLIRMADVIDSEGKIYTRPITKLALLPIIDNEEQSLAGEYV